MKIKGMNHHMFILSPDSEQWKQFSVNVVGMHRIMHDTGTFSTLIPLSSCSINLFVSADSGGP